MKKNLTMLLCALALLPLPVMASSLSYDYVQLSRISVDVDDVDIDIDGMAVSGSALLAPSWYLKVALERSESERFTDINNDRGSIQADSLALGLGYRLALAERTDVNMELGFVRGKIDYRGQFSEAGETDNGYVVGIGLRHLVAQRFELGAGLRYLDLLDETDTAVHVSGLLHLSRHFSAGLSYMLMDDADAWAASLRLSF